MRRVALVLCLFYAVQMLAAPADVEARRTQLNALVAELWEWNLQQNPVYASILGDKRYNDQLGSTSEKTILEQQAKEKDFLKRFQAIDATGLPHQDVLNRELEIRDLREDIEATDLKLWQMPVSQMNGIHIDAPQLGDRALVPDGQRLRRLHRASAATAAHLRGRHRQHAQRHVQTA